MTRESVAPVIARRLAPAAAAVVLVVGAAASAHDARPNPGGPTDDSSYPWFPYGDPNDLPPDAWPPTFDADLTGGAVFLDTSNGDAMDVASSMGFDVQRLYDGVCVADPGDATGMFDGIWLVAAINGMDPYAGAEPDFFVSGPEGSQLNGLVLPSSFGRAQFLRQPALTSIHANAAHRTSTGAGVVIAVLDSGVDATHPFLAGRVNAGYDFVLGADAAGDAVGHGTTVAGLAIGAAPDAAVLPVRVLDENLQGTASRIAAGIRYAVANGADVVNMSLGGQGFSSAVRAEIVSGLQHGVVFVAAAGNSTATRGLDFPASEPGVIAVSAPTDPFGDVSAPAVRVAGPYPGGRWFRGTGSSFAAALVGGGAALAIQARPGVDASGVVNLLPRARLGPAKLDLVKLAR
jgi:subtilisin family serine protease